MKTACIVIARKGSIRTPDKNEKVFCGHPLVAWSIIQGRMSHRVDATYLSTDGDELAEIGEVYGAHVIRRPAWPDADVIPANIPYAHAMDIIKELHPEVERVVQLLPTSPLRLPNDIDRGLRLMDQVAPWPGRSSQVCPVVPEPETIVHGMVDKHHIYWRLWDKQSRYGTQGGGMSFWDFDDYRERTRHTVDQRMTDADLDGVMSQPEVNLMHLQRMGADIMRSFPLEIWQQFEIDVPVQFRLSEVLMETFVLCGRGMDVYYEYGKAREVS